MGFAAIAAVGAVYSAYQANEAGQQQKKLAEWNAKVADLQAAQVAEIGVSDASQRTAAGGRLQGAQRAALAAQGINPDEVGGTAEALQADTQRITEQDARTIRSNATRQAWGFQIDAQNSRMGGALAAKRGTEQAVGGLLQAGGSLYKDGYDSGYWGGGSKGVTVPVSAKADVNGNASAKF